MQCFLTVRISALLAGLLLPMAAFSCSRSSLQTTEDTLNTDDTNNNTNNNTNASSINVTIDTAAPFNAVEAGQTGFPIELTLSNNETGFIDVFGLTLDFSRDLTLFGVTVGASLPLRIDTGAQATVWVYVAVDPNVSAGPVDVSASAVILDSNSVAYVVADSGVGLSLTVSNGAQDPQTDTDADGIPDLVETILTTDPLHVDSDRDGFEDGVEAPGGVAIDSDNDGTPDVLDFDSDNGGEPDVVEWLRGQDPKLAADDLVYGQLEVNDLSDSLDGGTSITDPSQAGATLSFREALTIAANRAGPDRIHFTVEGTINVVSAASGNSILPTVSDSDTLIEASGVEIQWNSAQLVADALLLTTAARTTVIGMTFTLTPNNSGNSGCAAFETRATDTLMANTVFSMTQNEYGRSVLANLGAAGGTYYNVQVDTAGGYFSSAFQFLSSGNNRIMRSEVTGGYWNIDIEASHATEVSDSILTSIGGACLFGNQSYFLSIVGNRLVSCQDSGFDLAWVQDSTFSANTIENAGIAGFRITHGSLRNDLAQNTILNAGTNAISLSGSATTGAIQPVLTQATLTQVTGTYAGLDGSRIDVFADPTNYAATYLGSAIVSGGAWQLDLSGPVVAGLNITATAKADGANTSELALPIAGP